MKSPVNILHLEDDPNDASLIKSTLENDGIICAITCVQNREAFVAALEVGDIDIVLSDFNLPTFDGLAALEIAKTRWPDIPLIIVSGTLGEERAVDSLKSGATDYLLKERLNRLPPAVRRAMQNVADRAEHKKLEAQFIQAQKMEVVGHLASGVAHDFNNILSVILGNVDLLVFDLEPDSPLRNYVEEIEHAADRAISLTRQLLLFSRKQTVQLLVLDLNQAVTDMDKMLRRTIGEEIKMTIVAGKPTGRINADPGYIGQVLMNLVVNARDAMTHGGELTIATSNVTLNADEARNCAGVTPGEFVLLSVSDTGAGMTEEVKAHIFEAFFTTKEAGKGTGLGLATCQTIVQQCGGHITVESELGCGTTFKVYFPRVEGELDFVDRQIETGPMPRGTETLLVVEDDPSLRQLASSILKGLGYQVLSAWNGQDALRVAREHTGSPIRLVVTDVIMPLMGGKVMAEWLKLSHPDLKILFTSGYTDNAIAHQGGLEHGVAFLSKPYSPANLARKVRAMLEGVTDTVMLRKQGGQAMKTFDQTHQSSQEP